MREVEIENEFKELWTKKYYVLVKSDNPLGYTIYDEEAGAMAIIEKERISFYIIDKMIKNGCKIYDSVIDLPKPTVRRGWGFDEWIYYSQIAKEFSLDEQESKEVARYVAKNASREEIIELIKNYISRVK